MRGKQLPAISSQASAKEEESGGLPKGWQWAALREVGEIVAGGTPPTSDQTCWNGNVNWITPSDLSGYKKKYISHGAKFLTQDGLRRSAARIIPEGSVLFSSRAPIGYVAIACADLCTNQGFKSVVPGKCILSEFLYYFLKSAKRQAEDAASGTTFKEISLSNFSKLVVPIAPLPEQHRIVARIEELFSSLDKGVEGLKKAQQQLKIYRQAVLKWAFEGRLTNKNVVDGKLPEGWKWTTMGDIADLRLGKMLDAQKNKGVFKPYLRNSNVRWNSFDLSDLQEMKFTEEEEEKYEVEKGDLIICEGGEPGRAAIWDGITPNMKIQKALHRVRFGYLTEGKYVLYNLMLSAKNGRLSEYFTGTTIKHLPGEKLKSYLVPLCSLSEQRAIVAEIESRLSVCDKIEETIDNALKQAESLRQSILKKAFEGKLVPQDPDDEPVSVLLARIKSGRKREEMAKPGAHGSGKKKTRG